MACRPFPGCQVRVTQKTSGKYGQKGGVVRITDGGDFVVKIEGREHIFAAEELSTKIDVPRRKPKPEKDRPAVLRDAYGQFVQPGDVLLYAKNNVFDIGLVEELIYFNKKPAVQARRPDGSTVKWSAHGAMMKVLPATLPAAVRQELGIEGGFPMGENEPMEVDNHATRIHD